MKELWDVLDKDGKITGRTMERGWMKSGDFHLIINVWIKNTKGEYLIAKRTDNKRWLNLWGCTIGSAITGDDSLTTALKETNEELGITFISENGELFKKIIHYVDDDKDRGEFIDVWLFT
ncbi:MAG: NUDIX domain-containing protein [Bacilli bacterium]|nr:NUDIX domain-containing protein [Bacilli bacterium]MDD4298345.1 NUDIX domain-containing protein [Bacilli bacterium]MDD4643816.1 NUDIX domain-containing protein [Bacilli bacterium]